VIERGVIANTVYNYPIARPLFSTPNEVELEPGALPSDRKPTREEVLTHYTRLVAKEHLNIHTAEEVQRITPLDGRFLIETNKAQYETRAVLVAVGGFGRQRKLGVPGEEEGRVSYRFVEAFPYSAKQVLVVGGGNSAAEASLFLAEASTRVTLCIRRAAIDEPDPSLTGQDGKPRTRIKPWVLAPLMQEVERGLVRIIGSSEILEIRPHSAMIRVSNGEDEEIIEVECDHIFALIGADPDTRLLESAGALIGEDGRPIYDTTTYETTVPGMYVSGHLTRELHMKNALEVSKRVADSIASRLLTEAVG
jgi:thioredoxin reductase (NADPH)